MARRHTDTMNVSLSGIATCAAMAARLISELPESETKAKISQLLIEQTVSIQDTRMALKAITQAIATI